MGAPFVSPDGKGEAGVSISVPIIRVDEQREREIIDGLMTATHEIYELLKQR